jgi:dipeptidyl aminopeptidase/acylaminoacyl peptidase
MRVVMMALVAVLAAGGAQAAPLETYAKPPSMRSILISPDGSKVAFIQRVNGKEAVVIDQLNPAALVGNIPPGVPFDGLVWADSDRLLAYGSRGVLVADLKKRKVSRLADKTELSEVIYTPVVRARDGRTVIFVAGLMWSEKVNLRMLESVDLETGGETRVSRVRSHTRVYWTIGSDGVPLAQEVYDEQSHVWSLHLRRGSDWEETYQVTTLLDPPDVVGPSRDGKGLVLARVTEDRGLEFRYVPLSDGKPGGLATEYAGFRSVVFDPQTHLPIGGLKEGMEPNYQFFDSKDQALWDGIVQLFPNEEVTLESWSSDRGKVAVRVTGLKHGVSYQIVDTTTHKTMTIGPAYDGLTPKDIADVQVVTYPAKDGLPIQALLTLPTDRDPKNLPLIVMPHQTSADDGEQAGYYPWAEAFASRGYAVLQPQYRGTSGLGWALEAASIGEFGRKMQTDLSDGVRALAAKGVVDPKRVCIVGGPEYGGYAALAGVMLEQGVYRCAVALNPWVEIRDAAGGRDADAKHSINVRGWDRWVGAKAPGDPIFDQISPSKHVADVSAPILIIHAKSRLEGTALQDTESIDDSITLVNALHSAKKSAELLPLSPVEAGPADDARRLRILQAMVTFVETNNPPN